MSEGEQSVSRTPRFQYACTQCGGGFGSHVALVEHDCNPGIHPPAGYADYQDVRELLDEFVRWDCSHCDDGEWMQWTASGYNARCVECGYTQADDFKEEFDIQGRVVTDGGVATSEPSDDEDRRHTHYCHDCDHGLWLMWDWRDDDDTAPVCGHCGGTDVSPIGSETVKESAVSWVVIARHDDPHPHIEEVSVEEEPARELMKDLRSSSRPPYANAWMLVKIAGGEYEVVSP